jgi:hypothetical protein
MEEEEEETDEEVSSEEKSMNRLDITEEKLLARRGCGLFFRDDSDTTSPSSEPRTPKMLSSCMHSDTDNSDDDNNDEFWM